MLDERTIARKFLFLTSGQARLRKMSIFTNLKEYRFNETWHEQPLSRTWTSSIGMWGGIRPMKDIIDTTHTTYNTFKQFRYINGLHSARSAMSCKASFKIALGVYTKFMVSDLELREKITNLCTTFGILPFEAHLYVMSMDSIQRELGVKDATSMNLVEASWADAVETRWYDQEYIISKVARQSFTESRPETADDQADPTEATVEGHPASAVGIATAYSDDEE